MKKLSLLGVLAALVFSSCQTEEPAAIPATEQDMLAQYFTNIGYAVQVVSNEQMVISGFGNQQDFMLVLEAYQSGRLVEAGTLGSTPGLPKRDSATEQQRALATELECSSSDIYWSGTAVCWNTVCFEGNQLVDFYTSCVDFSNPIE